MKHFLKSKKATGDIHYAPGNGTSIVLSPNKPQWVECPGTNACAICRTIEQMNDVDHRSVDTGKATPIGFENALTATPLRKKLKVVAVEEKL